MTKALGITDEVTTCDCCGKADLKPAAMKRRAYQPPTSKQYSNVGAAMLQAFNRAQAGEKSGRFGCVCGGQITFTAGAGARKTTGRCSSACGVEWANN